MGSDSFSDSLCRFVEKYRVFIKMLALQTVGAAGRDYALRSIAKVVHVVLNTNGKHVHILTLR